MKHAFYDQRPKAVEPVGNGNYLYHWDIEEQKITSEQGNMQITQYSCLEAVIHGKPTYDKCVEAVIRESYTSEEELAMINKYNSYQAGLSSDGAIIDEYEKYLNFLTETKAMVRKDLGMEEPQKVEAATPRIADITKLMAMTINTMQLSNQDALKVKSLYPSWEEGIDVKVGEKYKCDGELWKVVQAHKTQTNWKPSLATASLWERIDEEHQGTAEDPIPYAPPMQIYNGKYYTQNGVKYKCVRDSGIPLSHNLDALVGNYVNVV